jgi:8-oxo-dGTP pyrophosphatase MutT (NUDIX family)
MIDEDVKLQRIAAKALIINDSGECLILREASTYKDGTNQGRYHLPGGRINIGEHFEDGLKREVAEESELEIDIIKPVYVGEWRPVIKGVKNQIIAIFFLCKTKDAKVVLSDEHDDFQWIKPEDYVNYDIMPPDDKVIESYLETLK